MQESVFNIDPDMLQSALRRLDSMMATFYGKGLTLGYNGSSDAEETSLDQDSGLPDWANEFAVLQLALRLAPGVGKTVSPITASAAKSAYDVVLAKCAMPPQMRFPDTLPRGSGNKPWRYRDVFFNERRCCDELKGCS